MENSTIYKGWTFMDSEVKKIMSLIEEGKNFLLSGGAGSGKTYSLVQVIREVITEFPSSKIACMTYTNASAHEIERRVDHSNLNVSTIHDFLWDNIKNFQGELKSTLVEMINTEGSGIRLNGIEEKVSEDFYVKNRDINFCIQYKEYLKLQDGIISHDEVLKLSEKMFFKYPKITFFVKSRYPFIFIDEYQDTSPLIIKILLKYFPKINKKCVIGFFGDSMQSIYNDGIGNIEKYLFSETNTEGCVYEVQKKQNRRCPQAIINLANKLRLDTLQQELSTDPTAPNMHDGHVKNGSISFYYSSEDNTEELKRRLTNEYGWDFLDTTNTKELRLTHNLIANEAGFQTLMQIHDSDKIIEYGNRLKKYAKSKGLLDEIKQLTLREVIDVFEKRFPDDSKWKPTKGQQQFMDINADIYEEALDMPFAAIACYVDKEQLLNDKSEEDSLNGTGSKLSPLNQHLHKIEHCIQLYLSKEYNEFMRVSSFKQIFYATQKKSLREGIDKIAKSCDSMTISDVIDLADELQICIKDDKLETYIANNPYLWERIKDVSYQEAHNVYHYRMGNQPFSTQHKTKGLEYDNVLVILKSNWSNYDFTSLFCDNGKSETVIERTKRLFYVCCTRAKENLVVYFPFASDCVVKGAKIMFGENNVHEIQTSQRD